MGIRNSESLVRSQFITDDDGNPTGGVTTMQPPGAKVEQSAITIRWQDGIVDPDVGQNGAFIEDVLEAARQRLRFFNSMDQTRCRENSLAITKIEEALQWLDWRTRQRIIHDVENTYERHPDGGL